ncbi:MAG: LCP family protein [Atopostipes suicloacalis]|nr:LCP family protein [Atopostipes suicloacalis]
MRVEKHLKQKNKKKMILETVLSIFILLAIFLGAATGYYGSKVLSFLDTISEEEVQDDKEVAQNTEQIKNADPFSVLILGVDQEDEGASRSDTIIVATLNPGTDSMKLVSIPRDTIITLPDGRMEKINAAYATGGSLLAREMISSYLDIPIDFYAGLNFKGLVELVDAVDGVTVRPEFDFSWDGHQFKSQGPQKINGEEALAYSRMRKKDPRGDFGRQDRQKEVIVSILNKLNSTQSVKNFNKILDSISPYLKTNARTEQMVGMALSYSSVLKNIDQITLDGESGRTYFPSYDLDLWVWEANEKALLEVQSELKEHLELKEKIGNNQSMNAAGNID